MLLIIIGIYIMGFFLTLFILHRYGEVLDVDHYDPPHEPYYDDYSSNASAYISFSMLWPLYWIVYGWIRGGEQLVKLSELIGKKVKK